MNSRSTALLMGMAFALLAYIFVFEREDRNKGATAPKVLLPGFIPGKAMMVEVARTNVIRAERVHDQWRLVTPDYPAQSTKINNFLEAVAGLKEHGYISAPELKSQPGELAAFGLAPARIQVSIQEGDSRYRLELGNKTPVGEQLYVRLIGSAGVYVTDAQLLQHLPASGNDWRDASLLQMTGLRFNRIEVQAGNRSFELQRDGSNQTWRISKPMPARADARRVSQLVQELQMARIANFITDDPAADLQPFGLQSPEVDLNLSQGTNRVAQIQFGKAAPDPTLVFARRLSHSNVVLVSKQLVDLLRAPLALFRDKTLVSFNPESVNFIEVQGREKFQIARATNGAWRVLAPYNYPADPGLIQEFLTHFGQLEIAEFVKDVVTDYTPYGLAPPARAYAVGQKTEGGTNEWLAQIDFSTNKVDLVFARRPDEASVYAVSYAETLRLPPEAYLVRDRAVWQFAASNVTEVTITQKGKERKIARDSKGGWGLGPVHDAAFEETLHRLGSLRALSWATRGADKLPLFGFEEIAYQVQLQVKNGPEPQNLSIAFGKLSPKGNPYAAVTLAGENSPVVFQFPARLYESVVRDLSVSPAANGF